MPVSITMPALGESVTEGTITRWLKQEGDRVEVDEPLLEISTDKVDTEIPSPAAGVLTKIVAAEDDTVEVGAELALISEGDEQGGAAPAPAAAPQEAPAEPASQGSAQPPAPAAAPAPAAQPTPSAAQPASAPQGQASAPATQDVSTATAQPTPAPSEQAAAQPPSGGEGESTQITMPALGESVTEGTITRWLKQVGDDVAVDEPLLEISTDKVDTEIPSPVAGKLLKILVEEDATVEVGGALAVVGTGSGAAQPAGQTPAPQAPAAQAPAAAAAQPSPAATAQAPESDEAATQAAAATPESSAPAQPAPATPASAITQSAPPAVAPAQPGAQQSAPVASGQTTPGSAPSANGQSAGAPAAEAPSSAAGSASYVTPLVRKLAAENGVELGTLRGTGVGGRVRKQDVLDAADRLKAAAAATARPAERTGGGHAAPASHRPTPVPSPLRGRTEKLTRIRTVIARRMVESLQTAAQLTTVIEVDVTRIARLRQEAKEDFLARHGVKLSFMPFFAIAAIEALREHPKLNSTIDMDGGTVTYHDAEHLGIAVDTERGLIVPVMRDAGDLNLGGIARKIADIADRTRNNQISPDDLSGGTFTITNTGSRGALFDTPILNLPQVAMLGTGAVVKRAVVVDDEDLGELILPRSMVYLSLTYDHRIVDGADAARYLVSVKERLEAGAFEADLNLS